MAESTTDERILAAFLQMVTEKGLTATTTRALAEAAGVNEVTIFRRFQDKEALVRALFRQVDLAGHVRACRYAGEVANPQEAANALFQVMVCLRNVLRDHAALLQFSMGEYKKFPSVRESSNEAPQAAHNLLEHTLTQLLPYLSTDIDVQATTLSLMGLLLLTVLWNQSGLLSLTEEQWDTTLTAAIRPLLAWETRK